LDPALDFSGFEMLAIRVSSSISGGAEWIIS
jgi:hypothetical protein